MKLYLVQHADALSKDLDPARPLSPKGQQDAVNMAVWLKKANIEVDEVVHSGKLRADQTAIALSMAVKAEESPVQLDGLGSNDSTDHLLHAAQIAGGDLMVVSHMPFVARMASRCLTGSEDGVVIAFEPGSVLCLERIDDAWVENWLMRPSLLA